MKLQLTQMGKQSLRSNTLVSPKLFDGVWKVGETKEIEDRNGYKILGEYGEMFKIVPDGEPSQDKQFKSETAKKVVEKVETTRKRGKPPVSKD